MNLKSVLTAALFLVCFGISYSALSQTKTTSPVVIRNEKFVIQALKTLHAAEITFSSTSGNGNYGSLAQLKQDNLIDDVLASGDKYGYVFTLTTQNSSPGAAAQFAVVATPRQHLKTGRRSFYVNADGMIRGADKRGNPASQSDPLIEELYACGSEAECEAGAIASLRTLHSAEMTYQATSGSGNYGSLCQLGQSQLIDQLLATGSKYGYYFVISYRDQSTNQPATFEAIAIPRRYPNTGRRSFYVATEGVMRGADKNGAPANENDPPLTDN